jgi:hypothetical protein
MITKADQDRVRREVHAQALLGRSWRGWPVVSVWNAKARRPDKYTGRTLDEAINNATAGRPATPAELGR